MYSTKTRAERRRPAGDSYLEMMRGGAGGGQRTGREDGGGRGLVADQRAVARKERVEP